MTKTFTHQDLVGANSKGIGEGRGAAFRATPSAATAAAIVRATASNLASLGGFKLADILTALGTPAPVGAKGNTANPAPAKAAAPKADAPLAGPGYKKGDAVRAKYAEDGKFYDATFVSAKGDEITVRWVDGGAKDVIPAADVRAAKPKPAAAAPQAQPAPKAAAKPAKESGVAKLLGAPKASKDEKTKAVPGAKGATVTRKPDPAAAPKAAPKPAPKGGKK